MYVTFFAILCDISERKITFVNCVSHPAVVVVQAFELYGHDAAVPSLNRCMFHLLIAFPINRHLKSA